MLATIIISLFIVAAVVLAVRHVRQKGTCAGCAEKGNGSCACSSASAEQHGESKDCSCCH
ncbi:hypothetical protein [Scatolibacter rhodanostii]|uniref:hypothetical protein n=1 Tax=Scatolibacter rhodanostii TaxID=2014781 RepID=UPI000C06DE34|nr:hypothetical protein [Scatolibacter rhodanostii]